MNKIIIYVIMKYSWDKYLRERRKNLPHGVCGLQWLPLIKILTSGTHSNCFGEMLNGPANAIAKGF